MDQRRNIQSGRRLTKRALLIAGLTLCCSPGVSVFAKGDLDAGQARKLVAQMPGLALKTNALRVRSLRSIDATTTEATIEVSTAFRFEGNGSGQWRVTEFRTGQGQWQSIELLAAALQFESRPGPCDASGSVPAGTGLSAKRARCLLADLLGIEVPADDVRIKGTSSLALPFGSKPSSMVEATVAVEFRFQRAAKGAWQVNGVKTGKRNWIDPQTVLASLNAEKVKRARADLETIVKALEEYRRQRGFFLESKSEAALIDHLSPRYLARVIRLDPWHRPYAYEGTRDHFTLRSDGPDGKPDTSDDIVINGPVRATARTSAN
jgi:Type II secretion system (T2SS), protein G